MGHKIPLWNLEASLRHGCGITLGETLKWKDLFIVLVGSKVGMPREPRKVIQSLEFSHGRQERSRARTCGQVPVVRDG